MSNKQVILSQKDLNVSLPKLAKLYQKITSFKLSDCYQHIANSMGYPSHNELVAYHKHNHNTLFNLAVSPENIISTLCTQHSCSVEQKVALNRLLEQMEWVNAIYYQKHIEDGLYVKEGYYLGLIDIIGVDLVELMSLIQQEHKSYTATKSQSELSVSIIRFACEAMGYESQQTETTDTRKEHLVKLHNYCMSLQLSKDRMNQVLVLCTKDKHCIQYLISELKLHLIDSTNNRYPVCLNNMLWFNQLIYVPTYIGLHKLKESRKSYNEQDKNPQHYLFLFNKQSEYQLTVSTVEQNTILSKSTMWDKLMQYHQPNLWERITHKQSNCLNENKTEINELIKELNNINQYNISDQLAPYSFKEYGINFRYENNIPINMNEVIKGNVGISGVSGSGKGVVIQEMIFGLLNQNRKVVIFDVGRSYQRMIQLLNQKFYVVSSTYSEYDKTVNGFSLDYFRYRQYFSACEWQKEIHSYLSTVLSNYNEIKKEVNNYLQVKSLFELKTHLPHIKIKDTLLPYLDKEQVIDFSQEILCFEMENLYNALPREKEQVYWLLQNLIKQIECVVVIDEWTQYSDKIKQEFRNILKEHTKIISMQSIDVDEIDFFDKFIFLKMKQECIGRQLKQYFTDKLESETKTNEYLQLLSDSNVIMKLSLNYFQIWDKKQKKMKSVYFKGGIYNGSVFWYRYPMEGLLDIYKPEVFDSLFKKFNIANTLYIEKLCQILDIKLK